MDRTVYARTRTTADRGGRCLRGGLGGAIFLGTTVGGAAIGALVGRERWGPRTTVGLRFAR